MKTTSFKHIAQLVDFCFQAGITNVVISPGSRNAPLIIAFDEHPKIKTWLIHDERSAAFFALGISDATKQPVAICCTSGSAILNYAPAVAEAYYRRVPLLVLSADRPLSYIDIGDGQTIRQNNVLTNFVKASFSLPDASVANQLQISNQLASEFLNELIAEPQAPIHVNIPLEEPLYEVNEFDSKSIFLLKKTQSQILNDFELKIIEEIWVKSTKKLLLIGQQDFDLSLYHQLLPLLQKSDVAVLVENTTNLVDFQKIVHCIDRTLALISEDELPNFAPDLLITSGGAIISKKIKTYFRKHKPKNHWRVGKYLFEEDTFFALTKSYPVNMKEFVSILADIDYLPESNFGNQWKQKDFFSADAHRTYLSKIDWCDLKAFEIILDFIPVNSVLHMSNSSVVRYCQLFNPDKTIRYYSNRGVSGIDGSSSTAVGFSAVNTKMNVLITGDVSFMYDSNALWNSYLPNNLIIILINNGGGGIFKILEGSNSSKQIDYFVAPHKMKAKNICEAFNLDYHTVSTANELKIALEHVFNEKRTSASLVEVKTFSQQNDFVLKSYFDFLRKTNIA